VHPVGSYCTDTLKQIMYIPAVYCSNIRISCQLTQYCHCSLLFITAYIMWYIHDVKESRTPRDICCPCLNHSLM